MSIQISVKSDVEKALAKFSGLNKADVAKAAARAINRAVSSARSVAVKQIMKEYNIAPRYLKDKIGDKDNRYNALKVFKAYPSNITGVLRAYGKPIPLIAFPVNQDATGVTIKIKKGSSSHIKNAFISTMPKSGHKSVFARSLNMKTAGYKDGKFVFRNTRFRRFNPTASGKNPDSPIHQLMTTSTKTAVASPTVLDAIRVKVKDTLEKRMVAEMRHIIRQGNLK